MAKKMKEKFDKYWGDPGKMNNIIFISCILDPRYKLESVGYALVKMFGQDPGAIIQAEVKKYMTSLFSEYVKSGSKGVVLDSSSDCSSLDTSTSRLFGSQVSTQNTGLLESLMQDIKKYKSGSGGVDTRTKLDKYFGEETEDDTKEFDVLLWWKLNSARFPILAEMARDVLAVPVSSVASECAFSTGGRILDSFRSSLTPKLVQALVCLQDWLRNEKLKQPVCVEEVLDKIEQLEQDLASDGKDPSMVRTCTVDVPDRGGDVFPVARGRGRAPAPARGRGHPRVAPKVMGRMLRFMDSMMQGGLFPADPAISQAEGGAQNPTSQALGHAYVVYQTPNELPVDGAQSVAMTILKLRPYATSES
nr:zinc finger BED domain-containing protein RICESLEEPER 2-like [Nicotiana tomentosiformis]